MIQTQTTAPSYTSSPRIEMEHRTHDERPVVAPVFIVRRAWWSAIIAGAFTAIALQALMAALGAAIGLTIGASADSAANGAGQAATSITIGAGIWWLLTGLISLFVGGFVAGRHAPANRCIGGMHGFMTWATVTVLSATAAMMAGSALLGGGLTGLGNVIAERSDALGSQHPNRTPADPRAESSASANGENAAPRANDGVVSDEEARQAAKEAAKKTSAAAWWAFAALLLGAGVTCIGGMVGAGSNVPADDDDHGFARGNGQSVRRRASSDGDGDDDGAI